MNTNQADKATARPWKSARVLGNNSPDAFHVMTSTFRGEFIAGCGANEANAALIVQAVNERAALLAVVEAAQGLADVVRRQRMNVRKDFDLMNHHACTDKALHALAALRKGDK